MVSFLITIIIRLERAGGGDAEVFGLRGSEFGKFHTELIEMQPGDFFIEMFGQAMHAQRVFFRL